jgi:hypothetical protein
MCLALGLNEYICKDLIGEHLGSTILEDFLCKLKVKRPVLGLLNLQESIESCGEGD